MATTAHMRGIERRRSPNGGSFNDKLSFIWAVADLLRGEYRPHEYGKEFLPLVVIRRLDCVLEDR